MKPEELSKKLSKLIQETKEGKIRWNVQVQTTESNPPEEKPVVEEDGILWTVDECYVSYYCKLRNQEFLMTTYEMIRKSEEKTKTSNMIFLPPLGNRFFHLASLMPYSVEASAVLVNQCCTLWQLVLEQYKLDRSSVFLEVYSGKLTIEEEQNEKDHHNFT